MTTTTQAPAPAVPEVREPSLIARAPFLVARGAWRRRWIEAPLVGAGLVWAGQGSAVGAGASLAAVGVMGGCGWLGAHRLNRSVARMSEREWQTLTAWCGAAVAWTGFAATGIPEDIPSPWGTAVLAGSLVATQAWPTGRWVRSRKIRRYRTDRATRAYATDWDRVVSVKGHDTHHGSKVVAGSLTSPRGGAVVFKVKLRWGVHAKDACTEQARRAVEMCFNLDVDTVTLTPEHSRAITVAVSPGKHLEVDGVPWLRPELLPDGRVPLAEDVRGRTAHLRLFDDSGMRHWWISGASRMGKSTTLGVVLLAAGEIPGGCVILYADGGEDTSLPPELDPLITRTAANREEWIALVDIAHRVMVDRRTRRAAIKRAGGRRADKWVIGQESDPAVLVVFDETSTIANAVPESTHRNVLEIEQMGSKFGVGVIQVTTGTRGDLLIGGVEAKTNLTQTVAHRPQTGTNARSAVDSAAGQVDPMQLPPQPGWIVAVDTGQPMWPVRVRYPDDRMGQFTQGRTPDEFADGDLAAAGSRYAAWGEPVDVEVEETPEEEKSSTVVILAILAAHKTVALGDLVAKDGTRRHVTCDACPGWTKARKTASNTFLRLARDGVIAKEGDSWFVV